MSNMIEKLFAFVEKHGVKTVASVIIMSFFTIFFTQALPTFNNYLDTKLAPKVDVRSHEFFDKMHSFIEREIPYREYPSECIGEISKVFLTIKFSQFYNDNKDYVERIDVDTITAHNFSEDMNKLFVSGIATYKQNAKDAGVPEEYLNKFKYYHNATTKAIEQNVGSVLRKQWITKNSNKMDLILDILWTSFGETLDDLEIAFKTMELEGEEFNGVKCGDNLKK